MFWIGRLALKYGLQEEAQNYIARLWKQKLNYNLGIMLAGMGEKAKAQEVYDSCVEEGYPEYSINMEYLQAAIDSAGDE